MLADKGEFESIRDVLAEADEPLTAREILLRLDEEDIESSHRVATILGRWADHGVVEVIDGTPYQYRLVN